MGYIQQPGLSQPALYAVTLSIASDREGIKRANSQNCLNQD